MGTLGKFALLIAGPTTSGKSALAMALAARHGGVVINADAMQVYAELRIVTARPSPEDEATVPHALYGVRPAREAGTAAWWRDAALAAMEAARAAGRLPILCGGSGMYVSALTEGIATVPPIPDAVRAEARAMDPAAALAQLRDGDPETAATLMPGDTQRIARAWEVLQATGRGLAAWRRATAPGHDWRFAAVVIDPPRADLRTAIARRVDAMVAAGVLDEIAALRTQHLDPALPAMRAHGVPEFGAHLAGQVSLPDAIRRTAEVTGQYTKRQATWLRHHDVAGGGPTHRIHARIAGLAQFPESEWRAIDNLLPKDAGHGRDG